MRPESPAAVFWECFAPADEMFRKGVQRLQREGLELLKGANLTQRVYDRGSDAFASGRSLEISEWREGVEFAEHWDGLAVLFHSGFGPWAIEIVRLGTPMLVLREPRKSCELQRRGAGEATRWAGLLLDFFALAQARRCVFPLDLGAGPTSGWPDLVQAAAGGELIILAHGHDEEAPRGCREIRLSSGGRLLTSLPVKSVP